MTDAARRPGAGIAVIIPHYNDVARLWRCLSALAPQLGPDVEVLVVDNGSTEDLAPLRRRFAWLRLVQEAQPGAAAARNRGVAETGAALLCFLDADCVPAPDWLAVARACAPRAALIGGRITLFDETPPPRSGAEAFEAVFAFDNARYIREAGFSVTANLLTTRDIFEKTGPFREAVSEDMDWCRRAVAAGAALRYEPALQVAHPARRDWPALRRKWQRLTAESFGMRGPGALARLRWAARALAMPASVLLHLPRVLRHAQLRGPGERAAAAAVLLRLRLWRMLWMLRQSVSGTARAAGR